jgi:hypothetical protein
MAKRSRVGGRPSSRPRTVRAPAARPPASRAGGPSASGPAATRPSISLTEEEAARAAKLEAELVAQEKAAARARAATQAARGRRAGRDLDPALYDQPLSVRAAHEYAYVARDVRRIGLTAGLMLSILAVLALLINVMGVIRI